MKCRVLYHYQVLTKTHLPLTISLLFEYLNFIIESLWIIPMQFSIYSPFYFYKLYISFFYQRKQMWLESEWSLFNVVLCGTLSSNTTYFTSFFKEVTIYRPLSRLSLWKKTKNKLLFLVCANVCLQENTSCWKGQKIQE